MALLNSWCWVAVSITHSCHFTEGKTEATSIACRAVAQLDLTLLCPSQELSLWLVLQLVFSSGLT